MIQPKLLEQQQMRCKEWYGWHFPELAKIIQDNIAFCKTVQRIGSSSSLPTKFSFYFLTKQVIEQLQLNSTYSIFYYLMLKHKLKKPLKYLQKYLRKILQIFIIFVLKYV
jgi:RNA processing factor Prp31